MDTQEQARRPEPQLRLAGQDGWVGLVALLLALVIVAVLAQTALKHYGLLATTDASPRERGSAATGEVDSAAATPRKAIERARGLENAMKQQADDLGRQIDAAAK